jgi:hypothetical protein
MPIYHERITGDLRLSMDVSGHANRIVIAAWRCAQRYTAWENDRMNATGKHLNETKHLWRCGWVATAAMLSVALPVLFVFLRQEPAGPFEDPARMSYYRQAIVVLVLGLVAAGGALAGSRALQPAWLRWLSVVVAILGVLVGAFLLLGLIGSCGAPILWGVCRP